ncbi:MAG: hypothetical protein V3V56_11290, partial [bacterium]
KFRDHGWFVAYAPFKDPQIAIAILAEHQGRSGSFFAPIAGKLIAFHLKVNKAPKVLASGRRPPAPARPEERRAP